MGISREQALDCFRSDDLVGIGMEADAVRRRLHPEGVVSYVVEGDIEHPASEDLEELYMQIADTVDTGDTVRVGSPEIGTGRGLEGLEALFRGIRQRFVSLSVVGPSARQVAALASDSALDVAGTLARLRDAGMDSIGCDGVELARGSGGDFGAEDWLAIHRIAHGLGIGTSAAMIFGAGESGEQRTDFWESVRQLQDETGGFAAFIPVAADPPNGRELDGVTAVERLKTLAISRMFLDNIDNVQASAAVHGLKVLQMELRFGANDAGPVSTARAGHSEEDVRRIIRDAGFRPAQRDPHYRAMFLN